MAFKIGEAHWHVLISFMESHPDFARGRFVGAIGKTVQRNLWEKLSHELNSLGLGSRSVEKWQKSWADIQYTLKRKAAAAKREVVATGGGPPQYNSFLTKFEQRILNILGDSFYKGVESEECGVPTILEHNVPQVAVASCSREILPDEVFELPTRESCTSKKKETVQQDIIHDHEYDKPPEKRKKKSSQNVENDMYKETIRELKNIRNEFSRTNTYLCEISQTLMRFEKKQR